jgi:hypothetical protein
VLQKKHNAKTSDETIEQRYGSADLTGIHYMDTVCLHHQSGGKNITGSCIDEFDFMAISRAVGLNAGIDGILGLGPNYSNGPSFLMAMYEDEVIDEAIISFSLGYNNGGSIQQESYMMFGGTNHSQYAGKLLEFPIVTDKWWALEFRAFYYDKRLFKSFDPFPKHSEITDLGNSAFAVVDTGTSMMAVPQKFFERLETLWKRSARRASDISCVQGLCVGGHSCDEFYKVLGNITIQLGKTDFILKPEAYLLNGADLDP